MSEREAVSSEIKSWVPGAETTGKRGIIDQKVIHQGRRTTL